MSTAEFGAEPVAAAPGPQPVSAAPTTGVAPRLDYHTLVRREIFPLVPVARGTLLDVGGGIGATAAALKAAGRAGKAGVIDIVPTDSAAPGLDFHMSGNLERDDVLERTIAAHGPFDTILCLDVLEHLADPWTTVARLTKALAPGGCIVASLPNVRHYSVTGPLVFAGQWQLEDAGILDRTHLRWFVRESAIDLLTSSGLALQDIVEKPRGGRREILFQAATFGLMRGFLTYQFLIRVGRGV